MSDPALRDAAIRDSGTRVPGAVGPAGWTDRSSDRPPFPDVGRRGAGNGPPAAPPTFGPRRRRIRVVRLDARRTLPIPVAARPAVWQCPDCEGVFSGADERAVFGELCIYCEREWARQRLLEGEAGSIERVFWSTAFVAAAGLGLAALVLWHLIW